jgi:pimeloyl-ACP methyl ester carboxylesterase
MRWFAVRRRARSSTCAVVCAAVAAVTMSLSAVPPAQAATSPAWHSVRLNVQMVHAAGTTIAWSEVGAGSPLLLLNGTASPMNEWDPSFLAGLAAQHRVIVFDYPGLGDSGRAPGVWDFDAASDWVHEFLSQVSPGVPVDVLGWSMGGFIAQRLVARHPADVRNLVLAATNPGGSQAVLGPQWVQDIDSSSSSDADYLRTNYPASGRAAGARFLNRLSAAVDSGAYPEVDTPQATLDAMVAAEDPWLASDTNLRDLSAIAKPTLVMTGRQDLITPAINSARIAARIPGARLVLVPGAGHSFVFQNPVAVTATIKGFLASGR